VHALIPCGGCGEGHFLTEEEQKKVVEITVDETNGRVPVFAGVLTPGTKLAVMLAKQAKDVGADGVMVQTPHAYYPDDEGIYEFYKTISEVVDIPILIYNLPRMTQNRDMPPEIIARLAEDDNIVAIKDSTSLQHALEVVRLCGDKIAVLKGKPVDLLASLLLGARGGVSDPYNVAPRLHVDMYEAAMRGDLKVAEEIHWKLYPLWLLHPAGAGNFAKTCMRMMGMPVGENRKPIRRLPKEREAKLREVLGALGLLE
jgi:4-hydroxy-tetrahydrodipicolinate synthase